MKEGVPEAIGDSRSCGHELDHTVRFEIGQRRPRSRPLILTVDDGAQELDLEFSADHRSRHGSRSCGGIERIDPARKQTLETAGHVEISYLLFRNPSTTFFLDEAPINEHPHHLFEEERVPLSLLENHGSQLRSQGFNRQEVRDKLTARVRFERSNRYLGEGVAEFTPSLFEDRPAVRRPVGSRNEDTQHWQHFDGAELLRQQLR